jgi:transcriptional regulator with XRE-family HTH domain
MKSEKDPQPTVGSIIKAARIKKDYSQLKLSQKLGYTYNVVAFWEGGKRNKRITAEEAEAIIKTLGLPKDAFKDCEEEFATAEEQKPNLGSRLDPVVSAAVKRLRTERKEAQIDLSTAIGATYTTINRIESGHTNPTLLQVKAMARHWKVGYEEILDNAPPKSPSYEQLLKSNQELRSRVQELERTNNALLLLTEERKSK